MFAQRQAFLSAVVAQLLLTTAGRSAVLANDPQTTAAAAPWNVSTQPSNGSVEAPLVLPLHKPCGSEHEGYCGNGGQCMYPQDSDKPSCICKPSYGGPRCLFVDFQPTHTEPELEKLIGICFAVAMLLMGLGIILCCFIRQRRMKSAPLIKPAPSETSV